MSEHREVCEHCKSTFKNKIVLKTHINTNKKCLSLRGLALNTGYICNGCKTMHINTTHLNNHQDVCKEYKLIIVETKYKKELQEQLQLQEIKFLEKFKQQEEEFKIKLNHKDHQYELLKKSYENIQQQYNESKEDYKMRMNKLDVIIEKIATEAINKPNTTTNNNTITNIKNTLSSTYTLESLDEKKLVEDMRKNYNEKQFKQGQKGLAEYLYKNILKTPDDKLMISCSDTSRKKFKMIDNHGNLKEDIHARFLCEKIKVPVQTRSTEIFNKIQDSIYEQQEKISIDERANHNKLMNDLEKAGEIYINVYKFDEHESNGEFINELCVLLNSSS